MTINKIIFIIIVIIWSGIGTLAAAKVNGKLLAIFIAVGPFLAALGQFLLK